MQGRVKFNIRIKHNINDINTKIRVKCESPFIRITSSVRITEEYAETF